MSEPEPVPATDDPKRWGASDMHVSGHQTPDGPYVRVAVERGRVFFRISLDSAERLADALRTVAKGTREEWERGGKP